MVECWSLLQLQVHKHSDFASPKLDDCFLESLQINLQAIYFWKRPYVSFMVGSGLALGLSFLQLKGREMDRVYQDLFFCFPSSSRLQKL